MTTRRCLKGLVLIFTVALLFSGCADSVRERDIVGKTYVYENDGFGGDFTIQIKDDGTFSYYEGGLSSCIGAGKWTLEEFTLLLSDDGRAEETRKNYFKVDGSDLVFQSEGSSNFPYVTADDGDRFLGSPEGDSD